MSLTPAINFSPVSLTPLNSLSTTPAINIHSRISPRIFEKFETAPTEYLGAWGTRIDEKNLKSKISCQTPFNDPLIKKKEDCSRKMNTYKIAQVTNHHLQNTALFIDKIQKEICIHYDSLFLKPNWPLGGLGK